MSVFLCVCECGNRGAKLIRLELDDHIVFEGEVKQAPGQVGGDVGSVENCSEVRR